ncbi:hypothetical protein FW774_05410 (plasmid) [Pedobacter sp. BS3]|uniref:beta-galactosidase n=1 Tax=Pedobacter sp. BS3 TaxID=2567937 RepID=UPI0011EBD004|nr:beta-galactosidase [Pedobacter sp. BS3]TZF86480.1 hypothetical protein FW774_05410 [Pedobacter sp. BS3]
MKQFIKALAIKLLLLVVLSCSAQDNKFPEGVFGVWGHGPGISKPILGELPFIRGWNFTFAWKDLEPEKGKFNWSLFDKQVNFAAENNLYIGFMIWVGQNSPEWIYTTDGVPKVEVNDKVHNFPYFPYYFSDAYKAGYHHLLASVFEHIKTLPARTRNKMLFWMSAEGSTGDEGPYKGTLKNSSYNISMKDWFEFKKGVWSYMYEEGKKLTPQLNILINQANNGMYLDWLLENTPTCWFKAGSLAHTYSFNRENDYYNRLKRVVRPDNNGYANRFRSESEEVQLMGWFKQSPQQNTFNIMASSLAIGLDMINVRKNAVRSAEGDYPFLFFNRYAGQRNPAEATGAFCVLRDVLDVTDVKRFPESEYGPIIAAQSAAPEKGVRLLKDVNPVRIQNILKKFQASGAQSGPSPELEARLYSNDSILPAKLRKDNVRPDLQDKYNNDMGIGLLPDNYNRFLVQYNPNGTSKGRWRVGPKDQPYGRYARSFDHKAGMNEMWFKLDDNFYADNSAAHKIKFTVAYFDKGNGSWSLNYATAKGKTEKYKITCKNSGRWVVKDIVLDDAVTSKKLEHGTDFSLKYLSGDDTIFSLVELTRL